MIKRILLGVLLLGAMSSTVMAAKTENMIFVVGAGRDSCGTYLENRQKYDEGKFQGSYGQSVVGWVYGYVSATNMERAKGGKRQLSTDMPQSTVLAYMDKFCRDSPLSGVWGGSNCLILESNGETMPKYCK